MNYSAELLELRMLNFFLANQIKSKFIRKVGILEFQTIEYAATAKSIYENWSPLP